MRFTVLLLFMLLLGGCTKRYWYRNKIDINGTKKYSVKITIVNMIPKFLSDKFVADLHRASSEALQQQGYFEIPIDSPQFHFILILRGEAYYNMGKMPLGYLDFKCEMHSYKEGWTKWYAYDYLYYYSDRRDIVRSKGMVKYLIRSSENNYRLKAN